MTKLIYGFLVLMSLPSWLQAETLTAVIQHTLETNPEILMTIKNRYVVEQQLQEAQAGYWPTIDLIGGYGRETSDNASTRRAGGDVTLTRRETGLSLSQMLFDGFEVKNRVNKHQYLVNSAAYKVRESSETIALLTAEVYLEILRRRQLVEFSKDNVVIHQKILDQISTLAVGGAGRQADVQQSSSRLALAKSSLVNAQGNLRNTEITYQRITGELPTALIQPDFTSLATILPQNEKQVFEMALNNHPALQIAYAELEAAQATQQQAQSTFLPRFNLELGVTDNQNLDGIEGNNDDITAMLRMRYNLYRGGADQARLQESAQQVGVAQEMVRKVRLLLEEETFLAWNSLITTRARLDHLEKHVKSTAEVLESYKEQFKLGQRTLLDVLDSESELFNARTALVSAQYAEMLNVLQVLKSMGILLRSMQINLPQGSQVTF
jgi:adhesin transport system outer membrane protein